jgi:CheY-like chemotaxis protein
VTSTDQGVTPAFLLDQGFPASSANPPIFAGQQGVEMFQSWRPHFIWMDLRMPVMDGREATRRIRALPGGREVKIAAVTASAFISERDEVLEAGMDDFIRKPFRHSEIFDCMARHLGLRYRFVATAPAPAESTAAAFLPEQLALLPEGLRAQLKDSVTSLDVERITLVIRHISEQDGTLGSALARLADRLSFSPILQALEICSQTTSIQAGP